MFRNVAIALFAASAVVAAEVDAATPVGAAVVEMNKDGAEIAAALPVVGAEVDLGKRHKGMYRHRRQGQELAGVLSAVEGIFTPLQSAVSPVINEITTLATGLATPAESVVSDIESKLGKLTGLLKGATGDLSGLTGGATGGLGLKRDLTTGAVANGVSGVMTDVAQLLSTLKSVEGNIPGVGGVLASAQTELQTVLSSMLGELGTVSAPILAAVNSLLAPVTDLLSEVGLGGLTSILGGVL